MKFIESKILAWCALLIVVLVIILTVSLGFVSEIWEYSALFCAFMMVFCHIMALTVAKMSQVASKKLDIAAMIFGGLTVVAIIVIFIFNQLSA